MKKYYNMTLQPHLTEVTFLDKSTSGKTDILEVLKHIVSGIVVLKGVIDISHSVARASLTCLAISCTLSSLTRP